MLAMVEHSTIFSARNVMIFKRWLDCRISLSTIANEFGLSRERIKQIAIGGLRRIAKRTAYWLVK